MREARPAAHAVHATIAHLPAVTGQQVSSEATLEVISGVMSVAPLEEDGGGKPPSVTIGNNFPTVRLV